MNAMSENANRCEGCNLDGHCKWIELGNGYCGFDAPVSVVRALIKEYGSQIQQLTDFLDDERSNDLYEYRALATGVPAFDEFWKVEKVKGADYIEALVEFIQGLVSKNNHLQSDIDQLAERMCKICSWNVKLGQDGRNCRIPPDRLQSCPLYLFTTVKAKSDVQQKADAVEVERLRRIIHDAYNAPMLNTALHILENGLDMTAQTVSDSIWNAKKPFCKNANRDCSNCPNCAHFSPKDFLTQEQIEKINNHEEVIIDDGEYLVSNIPDETGAYTRGPSKKNELNTTNDVGLADQLCKCGHTRREHIVLDMGMSLTKCQHIFPPPVCQCSGFERADDTNNEVAEK